MFTIDIGTTMLYRLVLNRPLQINHYLYLDITNILVVSPQFCYIEVFDKRTLDLSDFVNSRFHCN